MNRERWKLIILGLGMFLIGYVFLYLISSYISIVFVQPQHRCFPYKVWLIDKRFKTAEKFKYGEYIAFLGKNIPYFKDNVKFVKKVLGRPGDTVEVKLHDSLIPKFKVVYVNDMPMNKLVRADVLVKQLYGETVFLEALATDTKNRVMPVIASGVIPNKKLFVFSPDDRSYDSRYWGLIDESQIIGKAYPIF